jgi:SAM-dependent methyltransferase
MNHPIIESSSMTQAWRDWLSSPAGAYLLDWEQSQIDDVVVDIFGYHALQLGMPELEGLRANRMPHQWLASPEPDSVLPTQTLNFAAHSVALPFQADSLDLLVMPHSLELSLDAHASLREAHRVLMPEGHLVITGLNPTSLWGWRHKRSQWYQKWGYQGLSAPPCDEMIAYWRLKDWLRLLGFEVKLSRFGCWRPAMDKAKWLQRWSWMDRLGAQWWPILGGAYVLVAVKKVHGGRIVGATWKKRRPQAKAAVGIAQRQPLPNEPNSLQRKNECESR